MIRVLTNVAGVLIVGGWVSVGMTLVGRQATPRRLGVYWLAMVMSSLLVLIYADFLVGRWWDRDLLPDWSVSVAFVVVYIMLGCLLMLVSWVDRLEHRERHPVDVRLAQTLEDVANGDVGPEADES